MRSSGAWCSADQLRWDFEVGVGVQVSDGAGVVGGADRGELVEEVVVVVAGLAGVGVRHASPLVPGQHLDVVQRRQVSDRVAAYFARSPVLRPRYTEGRGVDPIVTVKLPGLTAGQELPARQT